MGTTPSKLGSDSTIMVPGSSERASRRRRLTLSKTDNVADNAMIVFNLKNEIDKFTGDRNSSRYREFQKTLTTLAAELQRKKATSKNPDYRDRCNEVLVQINSCLSRLESKVALNEQSSLDLGSIESHSFINHNFKDSKCEPINNLDRMEKNVQNLEKDIKAAIQLEDISQFTIYEEQIRELYANLEAMTTEDYTPLGEKKARIGKKLIKLDKQLKKFRDGLEKRLKLTRQETDFVRPHRSNEEDDFTKMEHYLEDLEIPVLTFKGTKNDKQYKNLEQVLEGYWTKMCSTDAIGEEERSKRSRLIERIKNIMHELRNRADENAKEANSISTMQEVEQRLEDVKKKVEHFQGLSKEFSYIQLDQELRSLWAKLNDVAESAEEVKEKKKKIISDIQCVLKNLSVDSKKRESNIYENTSIVKNVNQISTTGSTTEDEIAQMQLLKQVEEFQNHWNQLNYNLDVQKITISNISIPMLQALKKITDGLQKKTTALTITANYVNLLSDKYKYPSSSSTPLTLSYQSYYQPPNSLQTEVTNSETLKGVETEIKTHPGVKAIGEIQRIGNETKNILQQIRQSNCVKDDTKYKAFKAQLENCRTSLESIQYNKKSDTIEGNRRRVLKTLTEAFRILDERPISTSIPEQNQRSSKSQIIMDIDAEIQFYGQQIKAFASTTKDKQYDKIKQGLSDTLSKLQMLDDVNLLKQDSIRLIQHHHQELERKLAENQAKLKMLQSHSQIRHPTANDVKFVVEQVQKLKSQIERFSGPYNGIVYNQIEKNLKDCNEKLDNIDTTCSEKIHTAKIQTKQSIQKYLKILEDKSTKTSVQSYAAEKSAQQKTNYSASSDQQHPTQPEGKIVGESQVNPDSPHHKINVLRDKLLKLKNGTEEFSGKYKDSKYLDIEKQIFDCLDELKAIDDKGHKSVVISKEQYCDYIEKLLEYFEDKSKAADDQQLVQADPKQTADPTKELVVLEERVGKLKAQVADFQVPGDDKHYGELKQSICACMAQLENIEAGNVVHVRDMKRNLIAEVKHCEILLENKAKGDLEFLRNQEQLKKIDAIMKEVERISEKVNSFVGTKNDENYCYLDETLIKMTIQLDNIAAYGDCQLREARKKAIQAIQKNMKILFQRAAQEDESGDD